MVNAVTLVGRLTTDPETKKTQGGISMAEFVLATKRNNGDNESDFIPVVAWRQNADFAGEYLTKGRLIAVEGSIRTNRWKTESGETRTSFEVIAERLKPLDKPKDDSAQE
ncbi:MAG: single-stranded DNA-binding protein [Armatimonadota bacterium]